MKLTALKSRLQSAAPRVATLTARPGVVVERKRGYAGVLDRRRIRARDSIVTFNSLAIAADDIVTCELQADETPRMILAELKALRSDLADQRECASAVRTRLFL